MVRKETNRNTTEDEVYCDPRNEPLTESLLTLEPENKCASGGYSETNHDAQPIRDLRKNREPDEVFG